MRTTEKQPLHRAVASGDLRTLAFLVGTMNNAVGRILEGHEFEAEPRPQLNGGDARSKIKALRELAEQLDFVADAIEQDIEEHNSEDNGRIGRRHRRQDRV